MDIQGNKLGGGIATLNFDKGSKVNTSAETKGTSHFVSLNDALTFSIISHTSSSAAGEYPFYFKNTSTTRDFYIEIIRVGAVNAALWKVWKVTGTAAGGSALTPSNLNLKSGVSAEATARGVGSVTGLTAVSEISAARSVALGDKDIQYDETLILGTNDAIAVEYDTGTTGISFVFARGYYVTR